MIKKRRLVLHFILVPISGAILSVAQTKVRWNGSIVKEGNITVVRNPEEPVYNFPILEMKEDLSLGGPEAIGDYAFNRVRTLAVDALENIYILDLKEAHMKVFDKTGKYIKTIGRKGQGPGELERPITLSINQTTGELVIQQSNGRISYFNPDGTFIRHVPLVGMIPIRGRVDSKANIIIQERIYGPKSVGSRIVKLSSMFMPISILAESVEPGPGDYNLFTAPPYWLIDSRDNLICGCLEKYEIQFFGPGDNRIFKKIRRDYKRVAITDEEKKQELKNVPQGAYVYCPIYHSAFRRFFLSDQGYIFVQTWEKAESAKFLHDIFDADGRFISRVPLKGDGIEIRNGKYYSIEEDEEGNQYIKRYALIWKYSGV